MIGCIESRIASIEIMPESQGNFNLDRLHEEKQRVALALATRIKYLIEGDPEAAGLQGQVTGLSFLESCLEVDE